MSFFSKGKKHVEVITAATDSIWLLENSTGLFEVIPGAPHKQWCIYEHYCKNQFLDARDNIFESLSDIFEKTPVVGEGIMSRVFGVGY